ncbi:hypothetical protein SLEP1_g43394 [Rubroshorea leprosula]|uniref:Uncharacterized protein n=1 Tax=Rubroshorea leprosula TaxID=152421 RepID=A0AAV5LCT0_9ROSI|nr:hypothetical protein SLEP1_g43389 [Rubroshorea leprosula]GKV35080.1 hypothetical protein SLEP1_g43394 [Rubroshorea leprosula]
MLGSQVNVTCYYCAVTIEDDAVISAFKSIEGGPWWKPFCQKSKEKPQ